ncbi:dioxygenase [Acinetobacter sp. S40]|uniref:DODA-type extradiol aromatic ring-opening family dioxygenase n=1 Tax=unclassified Acinetobacter TaxID=196816 RepID=UPI001909DCBB|nr:MULTISPECIES: class III extradiol ring-cleavage dioxygenase [unclassified Acinetobacter]MBJ9984818.1 dioxygenase [Acinetobacter sp. S40]MBK0063191.1 dioxygenase [Acinetobacter sp. S55]MBK0066391.1 dioxygenase [Acinetobacter sp. S54]
MTTVHQRQPVFFISHGGGPWPWMPDYLNSVYANLAQSLRGLLNTLPQRPKAILMISAHWEAPEFTVQTALQPDMIYDYGGFPAHTYQVHYESSGSFELAKRVVELLEQANIQVATDAQRGYDHGMFSPMQVINPDADIPVVQLSLKKGLNPEQHIALGRALVALRDENILIIGSGLSYHNLRMFNAHAAEPSRAFDQWLYETVVEHQGNERNERLNRWELAPAARVAHPREEHLLPLMVAVGAAENEQGIRNYHEDHFMGGLSVSSFALGEIN